MVNVVGNIAGLEGLEVCDRGGVGGMELGGSPVHKALMFLQDQSP